MGTPVPKPLLIKVSRVLDDYYQRPLNTRDDAPWSVLHWSIAYGIDATVSVDGPDGERVTAIGWLCANNAAAGKRLIIPAGDGMSLPIAPGLQGHDGQFLSMLAQSRVSRDYLLHVNGKNVTVAGLIEHEKATCRANTELTFKLIGLAHYEGSEAAWRNFRGEAWSVRRLLEEELRQPISIRATCGGLHRLYALSAAVERRREEGKPIEGPWVAAQQRVLEYQRRAWAMQYPDGSFSTAWLDRRESQGDATRRLATSGHILEWLVASLPTEQLSNPRLERAVQHVITLLDGKQSSSWHRGALGHALHALVLYEQRVAGVKPGQRRDRFAAPHGEQAAVP